MKHLITAAAALALLAGATGGAFAQPHHDDHPAPMMMMGPGHNDHGNDNHGMMMRGPSHPDWRKGGKIGHDDWGRGTHVDYRAHHLRKPPRGYEWRQVDGNYVLAAAATGLIASIILANQ